MTETNLATTQQRLIGWYEQTIPIRGCHFSLDHVRQLYRELQDINTQFGRQVIAEIIPEEGLTNEQWDQRKAFLLRDGFCLTVSIQGHHHQQVYGATESIFADPNLPMPIKNIYFNNITAWKRNAGNSEPRNKIAIALDFTKPPLLDPSLILSSPTPNSSYVSIRADDISYFRAVQRVVDDQILSRRTWYSAIHRSFAYDIGMWLIALPLALIVATHYMDQWLPIDGALESYRWAFFLYSVGWVAIGYRVLTSYAKWAFPVNVLTDNRDISYRHRLALGGVLSFLFYKAGDVIWEIISVW